MERDLESFGGDRQGAIHSGPEKGAARKLGKFRQGATVESPPVAPYRVILSRGKAHRINTLDFLCVRLNPT